MFFWYLVSVGASYGTFYLQGRAYSDYLKRNNYVSNTNPMGEYELKFDMFSLALKALTPGFNIYAAVKILWDGSKDFEKRAKEALNKGTIRKLTKEEIEAKKKELEEKINLENINNFRDNMNYDNNNDNYYIGNNDYEANNNYMNNMNPEDDFNFEDTINFEDNMDLENNINIDDFNDVDDNYDDLNNQNDTEEEYDFNASSDSLNLYGMSLDERLDYLNRERDFLLSLKEEKNNQPKQFKLRQK